MGKINKTEDKTEPRQRTRQRFSAERSGVLREVDIEKRLVCEIKKQGGLALKFISPGNQGVPDRIILLNGRCCFVEVKAPGKKPRRLQLFWKRKLEGLGFKVFIVDSPEKVGLVVHAIQAP